MRGRGKIELLEWLELATVCDRAAAGTRHWSSARSHRTRLSGGGSSDSQKQEVLKRWTSNPDLFKEARRDIPAVPADCRAICAVHCRGSDQATDVLIRPGQRGRGMGMLYVKRKPTLKGAGSRRKRKRQESSKESAGSSRDGAIDVSRHGSMGAARPRRGGKEGKDGGILADGGLGGIR